MKKYDLPYYEQYEQNADIMIDNSDYKNPVIINDLFGQIICKIKKRKSQHHPFVLGIC